MKVITSAFLPKDTVVLMPYDTDIRSILEANSVKDRQLAEDRMFLMDISLVSVPCINCGHTIEGHDENKNCLFEPGTKHQLPPEALQP